MVHMHTSDVCTRVCTHTRAETLRKRSGEGELPLLGFWLSQDCTLTKAAKLPTPEVTLE